MPARLEVGEMGRPPRILISGGGTGGHVFPAIAIADALKARLPAANILFVGARGKLEMQAVPQAGYPIKGLWISGFDRHSSRNNLLFPFKVLRSIWDALVIVSRFRPDVVVGVGGYASGPALFASILLGRPVLLQEQNSHAGITNRLLARFSRRIGVAFPDMDLVFPAHKTVLVGNPVRQALYPKHLPNREEACLRLGLDPTKQVIFVAGGSMGAASINRALLSGTGLIAAHPKVQILWQCGRNYADACLESDTGKLPHVKVLPFVEDMGAAYQAANLLVCRAGALTLAEICLLGKPALLVPSPNVAEDHQTRNALSLQQNAAAVMLADHSLSAQLLPEMYRLVSDNDCLQEIGRNARQLGFPDAAEKMAELIVDSIPSINRTALWIH